MKKIPTSRTEALMIQSKRNKLIDVGTEEQLQHDLKNSFEDQRPEEIGRLFATFQNPSGMRQHGIWVARGMIEGVSDLLYTDNERRLIGIEVKHPEKYHNINHVIKQAEWILNNCYRGGFCISVDMFWNIISGRSNGIDPKRVLKHLMENNSKSKSIQFKNLIHLQ